MTVREHIASVMQKRINEDKIISQVEVAKKMNVSKAAISNMIKTGKVDLDNIMKLCEAIQVTPNELLGYDENLEDRELLDILNADKALKEYVLSRRN